MNRARFPRLPLRLLQMRLPFTAWLCTTLMLVAVVHAQQNLPSMGEPADSALSPLQEQALGDEFMRQIRARAPLVRDTQSEEALQSLGMRLARASGKADSQRFTFFIVDDDQINAFAIPGGYIGVNSGLIRVMREEEQLAGVLAHEVAHLTQRHHARAYATNTRNSVNAAAALLAAILIGQASPEAGQATLAAGIAATQQSVINFTRSNEVEADRIGIDILSNAQFDPGAMAESFAILRRENSLNTSGSQLEYLRTHPLDNNRIAEAKDRAQNRPPAERVPQEDFALFKARLAVITSDDTSQLERTYRAIFEQKPTVGSAYALGLLNLQANRVERAAEPMAKLAELASGHLQAELLQVDYLLAKGDTQASRQRLRGLLDLYEGHYAVVEKLLDQQIAARQLGKARRTATRYIRDTDTPNPLAWRKLAGVQQALGNVAESHESLADYFIAINESASAASQLELALQHVAAGSLDELRLQASLKSLRTELEARN